MDPSLPTHPKAGDTSSASMMSPSLPNHQIHPSTPKEEGDVLNARLYYAETNLDNAFSVQIQNVGADILIKGVVRGTKRLCTMTANQQNLCSFPGFCTTPTPYNDTTDARAVKLCFRTDVHVRRCRICRMWYRMYLCRGKHEKHVARQRQRLFALFFRGLAMHIRSMVGVEMVLCV